MTKMTRNCIVSGAAIFISGLLLAGLIFHFSGLRHFPSRLADIYREEQIGLKVPGSREVQLNRVGAYGIYFHYSLVTAVVEPVQIPPALNCTLLSDSGQVIEAVQDYEPANRYWSKEGGGPATLIQSITVEEPGLYEFSCQYGGEYTGPVVQVSLGPNYVWEFIRISLKYIAAILGVFLSLTIPLLVGIALCCAGWILTRNR